MSIQHYLQVISVLPEPSAIVTTSGSILACNPAGARLLTTESSNNSLLNMLTAGSREEAANYLRRCARSGQPTVGSFFIQAPHDVIVYSSYGAVLEPRCGENEAIILLRLQPREETNVKFHTLRQEIKDLNQEIALRLRAEYELKTQTKWLEVTLTSIGDAVIITDATNCITFLNPIAETMTGWTLAEATGKPLEKVFVIVNEYTGLPVENPAEKALRERTVVALANHTLLISKFGEQVSIEDTAAPIMLDNEVNGVILVFHDVSDKRLLERQLIERAQRLEVTNRRKNEFLTMLAHELRSPITPISNAVQLMQLQAGSIVAVDDPRHVIERQIKHLKRLIDDMLDVSRITLGKMNIVRKKIDMASLTSSACRDFLPQFDSSQIKFRQHIVSTSIWIDADSDRIIQVLHNLLTNALKFTPENGEITVSLRNEGELCILEVKDSGIGIEKAAMADLFEPFTQAEQALDRQAGGLGLGLSLVKGIVDLHNGAVVVHSEGRNKGATITVSLPLEEEEILPTHLNDALLENQHHRILLIEDEQDAASTMSQLLEILGHEVHWARTGPEGLKKAAATKPTLIICDIGLPGLDGFAVVKRLRESSLTFDIPIVALTGYGESEFVTRAKQAGFDHHITKPASLNDIQTALTITR